MMDDTTKALLLVVGVCILLLAIPHHWIQTIAGATQ